jgi:hypothetical protein
MGFGSTVRRGVEIVKLDRAAYREVAADPLAFTPALTITALAGLAMWLAPPHWPVLGILTGPLISLASLFLAATVLHFVATLLGGHGEYFVLLRVFGAGQVLGWLQIVPVVGGVTQLWSLVIASVAVREVYGLDRSKAILTVLIPFTGLLLLSLISVLMRFALLGGLMMGGRLF